MIDLKNVGKFLLLLSVLALALSGCREAATARYVIPDNLKHTAEKTVDENDSYILEFDGEYHCVLLTDKRTGEIWSTTPYEYYKTGEAGYSLSSMMVIDFFDPTDNSIQTEKSYSCVESGTASAEINNNKLTVTYYYKDAEITVPIEFSLRKDSVQVSVLSDAIKESGKTKLMNVWVTPYFCSVKNTESTESYLFVPSGSGALMYTDNESGESAREYSEEVYGNDPARVLLDNPGDDEPIRLPCFGAADGAKGMLGIIEAEEGAARITALAGDANIGYSTCYSVFNVRGYNNVEWSGSNFHGQDRSNDTILSEDRIPSKRAFTVGYYPLSGAESDYNAMASCYRNYLINSGLLKKSEVEQKPYQITLIGGALEKKFFFGVPYYSLTKITDFDAARDICETLVSESGAAPCVLLKGFGASGNDAGKIAGGFEFSGKLGGKSGHKRLEEYCRSANTALFTDFDIVHFISSGNGFSTFFDSAQTANSETVSVYPKNKGLRTDNTDKKSIKFLARDKVTDALQRVLSFTEGSVSGISLSSFSSVAYSDHSNEAYVLKGNIRQDGTQTAALVKKANHTLYSEAANAYIAGLSDCIGSAPLQNGGYNALDETIPFYEMVYGGFIPLYSPAINLSVNSEELLLRAAAAGVSPAFTLGERLESFLVDSIDSNYYGISYKSLGDTVIDTVRTAKPYVEKTANEEIVKYKIIQKGVTETVFKNGTAVYVNYTDEAFTVGNTVIPARSYRF